MSSVNLMAREVAAKIVFYGPGLSGKTTTLRKVYETVRPAHRGEMMSIATEGDRTLFFDFLPVKVERVGDCSVRLALYTVPGQVFYNATRKLVLQGADGVVFVADSQAEAMDANRESLANLEENLLENGIRLDRFPLVMQWNKRDLDNILSVEELRRELNPRGVPDFETAAANGRGVMDALKTITRLVIKDLRAKRIVPPPRPTQGETAPAGLEAQLSQHLHHRQPPAATPA
ncbi:GTP-binding protein, partial [Corallococcus coralloides]|nr:GTP-binding protein [Corallococcus coralloides]